MSIRLTISDNDGPLTIDDKKDDKLIRSIERDLIPIGETPINGWTTKNEEWFRPFLSRVKYYRVINNFYFFYLKKKEGQLSWCIIVISTLSSAHSLINTNVNIFPNSSVIVKWTLVFFTIIITLISAYIKKQQFIDNINNIDRYLQQLNQVVEEINITFILEPGKRESYDEFCEKYIVHAGGCGKAGGDGHGHNDHGPTAAALGWKDRRARGGLCPAFFLKGAEVSFSSPARPSRATFQGSER